MLRRLAQLPRPAIPAAVCRVSAGPSSPFIPSQCRCLSTMGASESLSTMRARLLYQSKKRGILENDILLGEFAESHLGKLGEQELKEYDKMINGDHMEWDLYYYLSGKKPAPPEVVNTSVYPILKGFVDAKKAGAR